MVVLAEVLEMVEVQLEAVVIIHLLLHLKETMVVVMEIKLVIPDQVEEEVVHLLLVVLEKLLVQELEEQVQRIQLQDHQ
jgi:hypothetical protein